MNFVEGHESNQRRFSFCLYFYVLREYSLWFSTGWEYRWFSWFSLCSEAAVILEAQDMRCTSITFVPTVTLGYLSLNTLFYQKKEKNLILVRTLIKILILFPFLNGITSPRKIWVFSARSGEDLVRTKLFI